MKLTAEIVSAIAASSATVLLAAMLRQLGKLRGDVRKFMAEHLWLLATANWATKTITDIMRELGINGPAPPDWPGKR